MRFSPRLLLSSLLLCLLLSSSGCTNLPGVVKALGNDPAMVTLQIRSVYGTVYFTRDGRPNNGTEVSPEGGVKSIQPLDRK